MKPAFRVPVPRGSTVLLDDYARMRAYFEWYRKEHPDPVRNAARVRHRTRVVQTC